MQRTAPRLFQLSDTGDQSIHDLRQKLVVQRANRVPRMQSIDTEAQLTILLSRSSHQAERLEALERGEVLWAELCDPNSAITMTSKVAMRITLSSALRRAALISKQKELGELWTQRFAERAKHLTMRDFLNTADAEEDGRRVAGEGPSPHHGDDAAGGEAKRNEKERKAEATPMERYREELMLDHPVMDVVMRRAPTPGPRYTG